MATETKGRSATAKGTHYRNRTVEYFQKLGYDTAVLERLTWGGVFPRKGDDPNKPRRPFPIKKDQLGADVMAVKGNVVLFCQVKLGRSNIADAVREFRQFQPVDPPCQKLVVVWEAGAREPELIDAQKYVIRGEDLDIPFPPARRAGELF